MENNSNLLPPLPEFTEELCNAIGVKSEYSISDLTKESKRLLKKYKDEQNFCPLSPKLSKLEQILHRIVNELHRIFNIENKGLIKDNTKFQNLFELKFLNLGACRYSIEDAQSAIDSYKKVNFDKQTGYLLYYGLLQAMYVQQDSLKSLFLLISNKKKLKDKNEEETFFHDFYKVRETRNKILHSTDRKNNNEQLKYFKNYVIVQAEMNKKSFLLVERTKSFNNLTKTELKEESNSEIIDLYELIELQETILFRELEKYLKILKTSNSFSQLENI